MEWSGKQLKKYLWSCERKKAYTEWESRRFVWKMKSRGHQTFNRYLCKFCGHWHVGNKQVSLAGGRESGKPTLKREAGNLRSDESCALVHNTGRLEGFVRSPGATVTDKETERRAKLIELQKECLHAVTRTRDYGWITDRLYRCHPQIADQCVRCGKYLNERLA